MNTPQRTAEADVLSQESHGSVIRLVDLIIDPRRAFHGISDHAPWATAVFTAVALRFSSLLVFYHPAITIGKLLGGLAFQVGTVLPPVLLGSVVAWIAARVWGLRVRWGVLFSIVAHVYVAYTLATIAAASAAGAILPDSSEIDLRNPPFTNLGALVSESSSELARGLSTELDLRSLYVVVLMWVGLRAAATDESAGRIWCVVASVVVAHLVGVALLQMMR